MAIKIIHPTPGPTTTERVLELVNVYPEGVTARELSNQLNRPISMINLCLKLLVNCQRVSARFDRQKNIWVYHKIQLVQRESSVKIHLG